MRRHSPKLEMRSHGPPWTTQVVLDRCALRESHAALTARAAETPLEVAVLAPRLESKRNSRVEVR